MPLGFLVTVLSTEAVGLVLDFANSFVPSCLIREKIFRVGKILELKMLSVGIFLELGLSP